MNVTVNLFFFLNKLNIHRCNGIYKSIDKAYIFTYLLFTRMQAAEKCRRVVRTYNTSIYICT